MNNKTAPITGQRPESSAALRIKKKLFLNFIPYKNQLTFFAQDKVLIQHMACLKSN